MSILQFMNMSIVECVVCSILALLICLSYSGIGFFFSPKSGIVVQSVLGMVFVGAIGTICAAFCSGIFKYLIILFALVGIGLIVFRFVKRQLNLFEILKTIIPSLVVFSVFFIRLLIFIYPENNTFHYNCHETYFAGIPIELLKADYYSRLRIMDVYPFEWSKYHFFNGAFIAIPLSCFFKKNYISFLISKSIIIALGGNAFFDIAKQKYSKKKSVFIFIVGIGMIFVCAHNGTVWSIFTNNFSCVLLALLAWLKFEEKNYCEAIMFSIGYALSKSGSVISGGLFFVLALVLLYKKDKTSCFSFLKKHWKCATFSLVVGISVISMAIIGKNPSGQDTSLLKTSFFQAFSDWFTNMPLGGAIFKSDIDTIHFEFVYLLVVSYIIIRNIKVLVERIKKYKVYVLIVSLVSIVVAVLNIILMHDVEIIIQGLIIWYLIPLVALFTIVDYEMELVYWIYILGLGINAMLFDAAVSAPNYIIISFIVLALFSRQFSNDLLESKKVHRSIPCIISIFLCAYFAFFDYQKVFFFDTHDYYYELIELQPVEYSDEPFEYYSVSDADLAKLNAIKGNRVHYNVMPDVSDSEMQFISMSMRFLPEGYESVYT